MGDSGATILVKLDRADKMRTNARGEAPDPMAKFRINVGGGGTGTYTSSRTLSKTIDPTWNEEFVLSVKDPANSQLECSLWDESGADDTTQQKFLGEVILNLAKLVPHNNTFINQVFEIKQGKQHKPFADDKKATGKLKLGLKLSIPEEGSNQKAPSQPPSQPKAPAPAPSKPQPQPQPQPTPKAAAPAPTPAQSAPKSNEENVKPSMLRKTRDPDLPKGMVPPVALPGQGKLFMTVHTVQNVPKSDSAYGAPPYPYMIIALEGATRGGRPYEAKARTVTRDKEENPSYGEKEFVFGVDNQAIEGAKLHFKLFDWNRGKDEQAGSFLVNLSEIAEKALDKQTFDLSDPKRGGDKVTGTNGSPTRATVSMRWAPASGPAPAPEPTAQPKSAVPATVATPKKEAGSDDQAEAQGSAPRVLSGHKRSAAPTSQPEAPGGAADVGLVLSADDGKTVVSQIMPGGPAANSNQIRPGDALIDVDGHDVVGRPLQEVQGLLRGERNSPITMIFRRGGGGDQIVVTLLRAGQNIKGPAGEPPAVKSSAAGPSISAEEKSLLDSMAGLRSEFSSLSFLWGEPVTDAVQENMLDWKLNMLYGPKKDIPSDPVPLPPGLMQDSGPTMGEVHPGMRRSFNAALATGVPANIPIYRSFDQGNLSTSLSRAGGQPMRMSSEMRFSSPQTRAWDTPIYSNDMRFQSGSVLNGMPTFSYPVQTSGPMGVGMSSSSRPLTSMTASQSNFPLRAAPVEGLMQPVDKNEMVC